ncbi:MAG: hypothetical protein H7Z41_03135 [Cytophagales bacterium]|nr:hypothetical protein [Armatimonadota bacterium]
MQFPLSEQGGEGVAATGLVAAGDPRVAERVRERIRARFLLVAAVLVPVNAYWVLMSEIVRYAGHPTTISLFYNVIFWLCLLSLGNAGVRRVVPRAALNRSELLGLYVLLGITSGVGGHDTVEVLLPVLAYPAHFANSANNWAQTLLPNLPPWLAVTNKAALDGFYAGHDSVWRAGQWRPWALPLLCWSGFLTLLAWVMLCLNVLLRRRWTADERLEFPLVHLPLALTEPGAPLMRQRGFWLGVIVAAGLQGWNGIAALAPVIPLLPIKAQNFGNLITARPWSAAGWVPVGFYPFAIALGILLPLDMSFSSWFFFLFWKGQSVASVALGLNQIPDFPYTGPQSLGAYLGIAVGALWGVRRHLGRAFGEALFLISPTDAPDDDSPLSCRVAAWGILGGCGALFLFCRLAGLGWPILLGVFAIYFALAVAITRMRAELGVPVHDLHYAGPDVILPKVFGPSNFSDQELSVLSLFWGFNRAYRGLVMPIQMEGFKIAQVARMPSRQLFGVAALGAIVGPVCAMTILLHLCYSYGANAAMGPPNALTIFASEAWNRYDSAIKAPQPPQWGQGAAVLVGMALSLLLNFLRVRVAGFPFHPVGYAVASSWGMTVLWVPMLIAWTVKLLLLRYGGLRSYRAALPLVYGVIVGECVVGSLWTIVGILTDVPTYAFWP